MKELLEKVKQSFDKGKMTGFIGLKKQHGQPMPHLFTKENKEDLEFLMVGGRPIPIE